MKVLVVLVLALLGLTFSARLGNRLSYPADWTKLDRASGEKEVKFLVALKQRNLDVLDKIFWEVSDPQSPEYQNFRSLEEINALVAPSPSAVKTVANWLLSADVKAEMLGSDNMRVKTTVAVAEKLFNATFFVFKHSKTGREISRVMGEFSVPEAVMANIDFVTGLSEFPVPKRAIVRIPEATVGIVPQTVQIMYKTGTASGSSASSQGVIEFEEQYYSPSQLQQFAQQVNIAIPAVSAAHTVGTNDPNSPQLEATLDIQYIGAVGRNNENWFWIEGDEVWVYGFATHFFNTATVPKVFSVSYGWSESDQCEEGIGAEECNQLGVTSQGYVQRVNTEFQKIGTRGVSIFISSGDSGCHGRTDESCQAPTARPDFPGSSPYVTSVGATQITNPQTNVPNPPPICSGGYVCASGGNEVAVSFDQARFASGGGFSNVAPRPAYQAAAVSAYLSSGIPLPTPSFFNSTSRGYPDIAAFGSNVLIYPGFTEPVGGTSASSPIVAGVFALLNNYVISKTGKPLGFVNPLIYQAFAKDPTIFNDIVVGDNKCTEAGCFSSCQGFLATKGWDPVTGVGSPNYARLLGYVQGLFEK